MLFVLGITVGFTIVIVSQSHVHWIRKHFRGDIVGRLRVVALSTASTADLDSNCSNYGNKSSTRTSTTSLGNAIEIVQQPTSKAVGVPVSTSNNSVAATLLFHENSVAATNRNVIHLVKTSELEHAQMMQHTKKFCSTMVIVLLLIFLFQASTFLYYTFIIARNTGDAFMISGTLIYALFFLYLFLFVLRTLATVGDEYRQFVDELHQLSLMSMVNDIGSGKSDGNSNIENNEGSRNDDIRISNTCEKKNSNRSSNAMLVRDLLAFFGNPAVEKQHAWVLLDHTVTTSLCSNVTALLIVSALLALLPVAF